MLAGFAIIVAIVLLAGVIAYIGDRVGHYVGRRRLTLFNLRPKYTSTIVAIGTGMVIALTVTLSALAASNYARSAFFHLTEINSRVNQLQAEADALDKRLHNTDVVINRGTLLFDTYLLLKPAQSPADRIAQLGVFFDTVVANVNRIFVPRGLKAYKLKSSDAETQKKLSSFLDLPEVRGTLLERPVLVLAIADQNLFPNDPIHFALQPWPDKQLFAAHQPIASVEVEGGTKINPTVALTQLLGAVQDVAVTGGMPPPFARAFPTFNAAQLQRVADEIRGGRGRYRIVAQAATDISPHVGAIPFEIALARGAK